jgi:CheY-like chemotaxis protein
MGAASRIEPGDGGRGPVVLVVEDDPDLRDSLVTLVEGEGFQVLEAGNGAEALALLEATPDAPALVLLDMLMPVMDGVEFLRRKALRAGAAAIPVVVLSGARDVEGRGAWTRDVRAVLPKPTSADNLVLALRAVAGEGHDDRR